jgi:class 3 adenylate cyclase
LKTRRLSRGFFEGPPRVLYRLAGRRYFDAVAVAVVANGVAVSTFGVITLLLYVRVGALDALVYAGLLAAAYALEGAIAAAVLVRAARPAHAWLNGERSDGATEHAWSAAAEAPFALVRSPALYAVGALGTAGACLVFAHRLGFPAYKAALLYPSALVLYAYSTVLRYIGLELGMRPVLETIGIELPAAPVSSADGVSLHRRLLATVPMVSWGTAIIVGGLVTRDTHSLATIGLASVVALGVTAVISVWLSLVLADSVSAPIVDLRDATRRVAGGDLAVRVPVVSTDETGELAASFNAMVAGLAERERLHEAFGTFVDPALTERVVAEGTDLAGEVVEASILVLDVRGFTAFAERAGALEVVRCLNALWEGVVPVIARHGGHANKFVGDGLLAVFGAPDRHPDHAARAVAAAREIAGLGRAGVLGDLGVGLGVNSGAVVVGTVGGGGRRDFTVIGDVVNTAARVEAATRTTGDDLLITEMTLAALGAGHAHDWEERRGIELKGKTAAVRIYAPAVREARPPEGGE